MNPENADGRPKQHIMAIVTQVRRKSFNPVQIQHMLFNTRFFLDSARKSIIRNQLLRHDAIMRRALSRSACFQWMMATEHRPWATASATSWHLMVKARWPWLQHSQVLVLCFFLEYCFENASIKNSVLIVFRGPQKVEKTHRTWKW